MAAVCRTSCSRPSARPASASSRSQYPVAGVRVDRLADGRGEDVTAVLPELPRLSPLAVLLLAVPGEQAHQLDEQSDGATPGT